MQEDLRKQAKKKVEAKMSFYTVAIVFTFVTVVLLMLSSFMPYPTSFWLLVPIPILAMVLCIIYISIFGFPFSGVLSKDWQEQEIAKELERMYREKGRALPPLEDLSEEDQLELKELERLKQKWEWRDDLV